MPGNTYGVELEPDEPITVMWHVDTDVITISTEQARATGHDLHGSQRPIW